MLWNSLQIGFVESHLFHATGSSLFYLAAAGYADAELDVVCVESGVNVGGDDVVGRGIDFGLGVVAVIAAVLGKAAAAVVVVDVDDDGTVAVAVDNHTD